MNIDEFISYKDFQRIKAFSDTKNTPCLIVDLNIIKSNFIEMQKNFNSSCLYYAVKANPEIEVLKLLKELGSYFDIASIYELERVLSIGVDTMKISYGNTIKKASHIKYAYENGVRLFATDNESDLLNIIKYAPDSKIYIRLFVEGAESADWPLAKKFGCSIEKVKYMINLAKEQGIDIYGLSFHVGSQQRNIHVWEYALLKIKDVFQWALNKRGVRLEMINIGGGLPAKYLYETEPLDVYANSINGFIESHFGDNKPLIILEPGRSLVGNSGVIVSEIIMVSQKTHLDHQRWVYLDVGKFNGLIETLDEYIKYPIYYEVKDDTELEQVILAGPTCDSVDIMYEKQMYEFPKSIKSGERMYFLSTGAYTSSYASVGFNGFPPIKVHCIK